MKSITIQANEPLINSIIAIVEALAKSNNEVVKIDDNTAQEIEARIQDYYNGKSNLISFDEMKERLNKW